jgi:hypothetical protein
LIAIHDADPGPDSNPYSTSGPGELARIIFSVSNDYNYAGEFAPVRFYWCDCRSNELFENSLDWVLLGRDVFDQAGNRLSDSSETFGYGGPEDDCLDTTSAELQSEGFKHIPAIDFHGGGIAIIPVEVIDDGCRAGDINNNYHPYEIADAVVLANYFIYGPSAFTINFQCQKNASEINGDGVPLTLADLVYLIRILDGDALPSPQPDFCALATFSMSDDTVKVETDLDLGAVRLVFDGKVTPHLTGVADSMDVIYNDFGDQTYVLVFSFEEDEYITSGNILTIDGKASLDSVETAEYRGTIVTAKIE